MAWHCNIALRCRRDSIQSISIQSIQDQGNRARWFLLFMCRSMVGSLDLYLRLHVFFSSLFLHAEVCVLSFDGVTRGFGTSIVLLFLSCLIHAFKRTIERVVNNPWLVFKRRISVDLRWNDPSTPAVVVTFARFHPLLSDMELAPEQRRTLLCSASSTKRCLFPGPHVARDIHASPYCTHKSGTSIVGLDLMMYESAIFLAIPKPLCVCP